MLCRFKYTLLDDARHIFVHFSCQALDEYSQLLTSDTTCILRDTTLPTFPCTLGYTYVALHISEWKVPVPDRIPLLVLHPR